MVSLCRKVHHAVPLYRLYQTVSTTSGLIETISSKFRQPAQLSGFHQTDSICQRLVNVIGLLVVPDD